MADRFVSCESAEHLHRQVVGGDVGQSDAASSPAGRLVSGEGLNYGLGLSARGETGRRTTLRW